MIGDTRRRVMHVLDEKREELIHRVSEALFAQIPVLGIWEKDTEKEMHHHHNMALTAERFHDIVQAGATIDWSLVSAEFGWADRKLSTMGITRDHRRSLMQVYLQEALQVYPWSDEERAELECIGAELREVAEKEYVESVPSP